MKKILFSILILGAFLVSCTEKSGITVTVENASDFDRLNDLVEVTLEEVIAKVKLGEGQIYVVKNSDGQIIPSQITNDGKLIFQAGVKANDISTFTIEPGAAQNFEAKTYGRFITERKDDFAWENDRVAFRIYGPALLEVDGPSNGIDIWYKRTDKLIVDKWYKDDLAGVASYHEDHGEGLDDYKVGRTLGAGAMAPYVNDVLWLNENFVSQEIIDNGPLRTTFKLTYKDIEVDGKTYPETRTISIDAGSQFSRITQEYGGLEAPMTVAAGIVKRENDSIISSVENNYIVYAEPASEKVGNVYLAMVFPAGLDKTVVDTYTIKNEKAKTENSYSHVLGVVTNNPNTPVTYYTGYGWSKFGFESLDDFNKYVDNFSKSLKQPLTVTIK